MEEYYRYCSPDHDGKGRKGFLKIDIQENTVVLDQPFLHGMHVPPLFRAHNRTAGEPLPSIHPRERMNQSISMALKSMAGIQCSRSSHEGPASADETIEDPAPEGHPVAGPAQLRPFGDGVRHAVALEGKAAHQPSQILTQTTLD
ncbi:hypothetical protein E2320_016415, partial [Naja naja]